MSHEIRTPLNAILGMTALALQTTALRRAAGLPDDGQVVGRSRCSTIINDILDFSKIEARRLDLDQAEFDLRETVGDAAKLLALRAAEKGIELACDVAPDVPERARRRRRPPPAGAAERLGNAVKFTTEGEVVLRVDVRVRRRRPRAGCTSA